MSKKVLGRNWVRVSVDLAREYGVPEAFLLEKVHNWCLTRKAPVIHGERWVQRSMLQWAEELPYSISTVERAMKSLVDKGLIEVHRVDGSANWYRVAYQKLNQSLLVDESQPGDDESESDHRQDGGGLTHLTMTEDPPPNWGEGSVNLPESHIEGINQVPIISMRATHDTPEVKMKIVKNPEEKVAKKNTVTLVKGKTPGKSAAILAGLTTAKPVKLIAPNTKESAAEIWRGQNKFFELQQTVPVLTNIEKSKLAACVSRWGPTSDDTLTVLLKRWMSFGAFVRGNKWPNFSVPTRPSIDFIRSNLNDATEFAARELSAKKVAEQLQPVANPKPASAKLPLPVPTGTPVHHSTQTEKPATLEEIEAINKELGL